jgi:hypothetical protein
MIDAIGTIVIPDHIRPLLIEDIGLSRRSLNGLLRADVRRVGDLHGLTWNKVLAMRNLGTKSVREIAQALEQISGRPVTETPLQPEEPAERSLVVRETLQDWPISALYLPKPTENALRRRGCTLVRSLSSMPFSTINSFAPFNSDRADEVQAAIESVSSSPWVGRVTRTNAKTKRPRHPDAPLDVVTALWNASSVESEHRALLQGLSNRNADFLWKRWQTVDGRKQHHLEDLGESAGITRERVRQIILNREDLLRKSNLRLPISESAVSILDNLGGAATAQGWISQATKAGLEITKSDLERLETIARLGLLSITPRYDVPSRLWFTQAGFDHWIAAGNFSERKIAARKLRKYVQDFGAIPREPVESLTPLGITFNLRLIAPKTKRARRVGDYFVLEPAIDCSLVKIVRRCLAVTQPMTIADVYNGITRWWPYHSMRGPGRVTPLPPESVVKTILAHHPDFAVENGTVRTSKPIKPSDVLRPSEIVALDLFEEKDGIVVWQEFHSAMRARGIAMATASLSLRAPFIVRRGSCLYALRGRDIPKALSTLRRKERDQLQESAIGAHRWVSADRYEITYRITTFTSQGVFPAPSALRGLKTTTWSGRFPDGTSQDVTLKKGFLSKLHPWLTRVKAANGDELVATFFVGEGVIEFDLISTKEGV